MELVGAAATLGQPIRGLQHLRRTHRRQVQSERPPRPSPTRALLELLDVGVTFDRTGQDDTQPERFTALSAVNLQISAGQSVALIGESGSGKSTLAHSILQLPAPSSGQIRLRGLDLAELPTRERRRLLQQVQIVFQNPIDSLDPTWKIESIVAEQLRAVRMPARLRQQRENQVLELVGLDPTVWGRRRRRELSGGQAQLVAVARALAASPSLLICDEAVSSLDPPARERILTLRRNLQEESGMAWLLITHDHEVAENFCDRVVLLHQGSLSEPAPTARLMPAATENSA